MRIITMLAEFFLLSLGLGVGFFSFLADTKKVGAGFLKIIAGICALSLLLALGLHLSYGSFRDPQTLQYIISILSFALVYFFHRDRKSLVMWILYGVHNISLTLLLIQMNNGHLSHFLFSLSSVMLLGSVTYAMIMGHWYLVTPKLSEAPLCYALYFTWFFFLIKVGWTIHTYTQSADFFEAMTTSGGGYAFNGMMLAMRVGCGYLALGGMSIFAYKLVNMRSTQSATGMFYAMTFFVFLGELASNYMALKFGLLL